MMMSTDLPANNSTEMAKWRDLPITDAQRRESLVNVPVRVFRLAERGWDESRFTSA
jgi:predicted TIM-barrel fold metal-dependent hydrolase